MTDEQALKNGLRNVLISFGHNLPQQQWVKEGDRSHENLQTLDNLNLSYPGWELDVREAEECHTGSTTFQSFSSKLQTMALKQALHDGDRSHPRLKELDELNLTYPGNEDDIDIALDQHLSNRSFNFSRKIEGMKQKQKIFEGDRSHPNLVLLDSLKLTYPGHQKDVKKAEESHTGSMWSKFEDIIFYMTESQNIHDGNRSHPRLKALDALKLEYEGCEDDKASLLEQHLCNHGFNFQVKLKGMKQKQKIFEGDRSHPNLVLLDSVKSSLTYPDHEKDVEKAEESHTGSIWSTFDDMIFLITESQNIHDCNYSHPRLKQLHSITFTYPGWEDDQLLAHRDHIHSWKASFDKRFQGMVEKQRIYDGYFNADNTIDTDHDKIYIGECLICYQRAKSHAVYPCGHLCLCHVCATHSSCNHKCPICRTDTRSLLKVFAPFVSKNIILGNCLHCGTNVKSHAFVPCGHMALCESCIPKNTLCCPVCKNVATQCIRLYIS